VIKSAEDLMGPGIEVKPIGKFVAELMLFERAGR
jgi:hypothetical protein